MLENSNGKLLVYAPDIISSEKRFSSISAAAEKMARLLKLSFEIVTFEEETAPIYVYYENGGEDPIPIYCDKGEKAAIDDVYTALMHMMFVLSFHPKHSVLKEMRKEIIRLS